MARSYYEALYIAELGRSRALADILSDKYSVKEKISVNPQSWIGIENIMDTNAFSSCLYISCFGDHMCFWILKPNKTVVFRQTSLKGSADKVFENQAFGGSRVLRQEQCEDRSMLFSPYESSPPSFKPSQGDSSSALRLIEEGDDKTRETGPPTLADCYKMIISPVADLLQEPEIVIIPDGLLYPIPFAALKDDNGKYLSDTFKIRIVPSLTTLKLIQNSPADYRSKSGALIVGDPDVSVVYHQGKVIQLNSLPWARKEAEMIGRLLGVQPLLGRDATKQKVLEKMHSVSLVHFAAHGYAERGEIALSPIRFCGIPHEEDYLLTMAEISQVRLSAKLVVLSCCHSARGQIRAEGVVGIARAFLASGARAVLAALWAVEDEATMWFMNRFYEHLVRGESASECLQQAMKSMRENHFSDVKQWAPFMLIGDDVAFKDVLQLDKLSVVSEPSLKYAHEGESVEGPEDNNSKDPGEVPIATAIRVRDIRAATMMFEAKHEECIRVLPYIKGGQIVVQFYVYSGESGIPKDLEEEAQQFFKKMNVKLEWSDLYNNSVNVLKVQRLVYSSEKPKTLTASQVDEMNDVIEKNLPELSKHRNITSVQASFKIKNSTRTDEPCVTLYVLGKGFFPIGERKFPNVLGDYLVDVVNGFWTRAGNSKYWEPNSAQKPSKILCSGVSIGVQGKEAAGTLGAIVKNGSTFYALSNHHVMNSEQSNLIVHPALYDHLNYLRYYLAQYRREVKDVTDLETQDSVNDLTTREALVSNFEELKSRKDIYVQGYSSEGELFLELIEKAEEDFQQGKEPPREIGEWKVGVCENFVWSDGKKYYIDAAIAKLFDKEVKNFEGKTARLIGNDGKPRGCSPVDKETIFNNRLCKSGRTTVYTEIENRIVGNKKNVETPHYMICSPCYDLRDLPFISYEMKEFACETCEEKQFIVTDSTKPLFCDNCVEKEATLRVKFWRYRVLCISEGEKRFAEDGDSGAVIFEIDQTEGDEKFLSGLGLFFAKGQTQHDRLYFASPLKIVLDALTDKLPKGSNLELVSKF